MLGLSLFFGALGFGVRVGSVDLGFKGQGCREG